MKKGVGPIAVGVFAMLALLVLEGVGLQAFISRGETYVRIVRETNIIQGINKVEFTKKSLSQALEYSFHQASYLVSSRGGFYDLTSVDSYDCVPYLNAYGATNYPDKTELIESLEQGVLAFLNNYVLESSGEVSIPYYDEVIVEETGYAFRMSAFADDSLILEREKVSIKDNPNLDILVESRVLELHKLGKKHFMDLDIVESIVNDASNYGDFVTKLSQFEGNLNSVYDDEEIRFELEPENIGPGKALGQLDTDFVTRVLVRIIDESDEYKAVAYDYQDGTTDSRSVELSFYVLFGKEEIDPITNECKVEIILPRPQPTSCLISADSTDLEVILYPSPNCHTTRWETEVDRLVIHYTAGNLEGTLSKLTDSDEKVSAHYVLDRDGTIYQLVSESYNAWHADCEETDPKCVMKDMNSRSIGIEIVNWGFLCSGKGFPCVYLEGKNWEVYPEEQIQMLVKLSADIIRRNPGIKVDRTHIIGHEEVYLGKLDPGPAFPWNEYTTELQKEI